ncbi:hypothetical protein K438DRAFT_2022842 [Mycena galopus ATCC 62051]|nr:hypothetical protein K438DRAFT_2022842 [Mycena galopus ATCC 62051]
MLSCVATLPEFEDGGLVGRTLRSDRQGTSTSNKSTVMCRTDEQLPPKTSGAGRLAARGAGELGAAILRVRLNRRPLWLSSCNAPEAETRVLYRVEDADCDAP